VRILFTAVNKMANINLYEAEHQMFNEKTEIPIQDLIPAPGSPEWGDLPIPTMLGEQECIYSVLPGEYMQSNETVLIKIATLLGIEISDIKELGRRGHERRKILIDRIYGLFDIGANITKYPYYKLTADAGFLLEKHIIEAVDGRRSLRLTLYDKGSMVAQQEWLNGILIFESNNTAYVDISRRYTREEPYYLSNEIFTFKTGGDEKDANTKSNKIALGRQFFIRDSKAYVLHNINTVMVSREQYYLMLTKQKEELMKLSKEAASSITVSKIPEIQRIIGSYLMPEL
jgi:hypothetical protein